MFPNRILPDGNQEVPKTLIFAKTDSHADDIINIVREEFGEGNEWKQSQVRQYFDTEELLIGKDYWNFVCDDLKGFDVVFEQYQKSSKYIKDAIEEIKAFYFG